MTQDWLKNVSIFNDFKSVEPVLLRMFQGSFEALILSLFHTFPPLCACVARTWWVLERRAFCVYSQRIPMNTIPALGREKQWTNARHDIIREYSRQSSFLLRNSSLQAGKTLQAYVSHSLWRKPLLLKSMTWASMVTMFDMFVSAKLKIHFFHFLSSAFDCIAAFGLWQSLRKHNNFFMKIVLRK